MRSVFGITLLTCFAGLLAAAPNLQIYFIDVEGGAATLIIGPAGESLLADTGSMTPDDRGARRIFEVAKLAGPLFHGLSYHDIPEGPPAATEMRYVDASAQPGEKHSYSILTINGAGVVSELSTAVVISSAESGKE